MTDTLAHGEAAGPGTNIAPWRPPGKATAPETRSGHRWTQRKRRFVECYFEHGRDGAKAAREAGYAVKAARQSAYALLHEDPLVKHAIAEREAEIQEQHRITVDDMVKQFDEDREFAVETQNATAAVRASELKAKLAGLLVDRRDVRAVGGFMVRIEGVDFA